MRMLGSWLLLVGVAVAAIEAASGNDGAVTVLILALVVAGHALYTGSPAASRGEGRDAVDADVSTPRESTRR